MERCAMLLDEFRPILMLFFSELDLLGSCFSSLSDDIHQLVLLLMRGSLDFSPVWIDALPDAGAAWCYLDEPVAFIKPVVCVRIIDWDISLPDFAVEYI